jgi:membrane AbrB-like protein
MPAVLPTKSYIDRLLAFSLTIAIGLCGTAFAISIGMPAAYLSGPVVAVALASFLGFKPFIPAHLTQLAFVLVGVMMGTTITPDVIAAIKTWPLSFIAVIIAIYILLYAAYWILKHLFGYDHNTAMLASSPGHLTYVLSLAATVKADIAAVSVVQSVRLIALTLSVPIIVEYFDLIDPEQITMIGPMPFAALLITVLASLALGLLFSRWNFPAALLLGGVAISGSTHLGGIVQGGVPDWLGIPTYIFLGCMIGARFSSFTSADFRRALLAGLIVTVAVVVIAGIFAVGVSHLTGVQLNAVMIAFAPGGLETMSAMAIMMHADTAYVGAHHILRLFFLTFLMPFVLQIKKQGA